MSEDLRSRLAEELGALWEARDVLLDRLEFLEDSLAALQAREEIEATVARAVVR